MLESREKAVPGLLDVFADAEVVAQYAHGPQQYVPGLDALHRMTGILLAERAPEHARVLVLGAGGGMEIKAVAETHPGWTFVGVDPSAEMLKLAVRTLGPFAALVELVQGYVDDAPEGPFDAAVCLLTLHFLEADERRRTVEEVRRRLRPRAPFVVAHNCLPPEPVQRALWLSRYSAFAIASGADPKQAETRRAGIGAWPGMLPPERDEEILSAAGFSNVSLFYAAFSWRGWVGYA